MDKTQILNYDKMSSLITKKMQAHPKSELDLELLKKEEQQLLHFLLSQIVINDISTSNCIYCNTLLTTVDVLSDNYPHLVSTEKCENCGWWYTMISYEDEDQYDRMLYPSVLLNVHNIDDRKLPLDLLFDEFSRKKDVLFNIDATVFEKFIGELLKGVYDCEVHHCGKSGDGGIDLILLNSETPTVIQVKRRKSSNKIESLNVVREFVGAMAIKGYKRGIFISTSKSYTKGSKLLSIEAMKPPLKIESIELWNYQKIIDIFELSNPSIGHCPWKDLKCYVQYENLKLR